MLHLKPTFVVLPLEQKSGDFRVCELVVDGGDAEKKKENR